jgi:hypothetical protein
LILLPVHTYKQPLYQARRWPPKLLLSATAAVILVALCTYTCAATEAGFERPDVLVLVMGGLGPSDQCAINYTTVVPTKIAQADLDTIAKLGNWHPFSARSETKASGGPSPKPTTGVSWWAGGIIGAANGTLPLEPFVTALKRFKFIEIVYIVPSGFEFRGLKDFDNEYVSIRLMPGQNSYRYRVVVKDSSFAKLDLPLTESAKPKPAAKPRMSTTARLVLALGIGIPAAMIVYLIALYFSKRR